MKAYYVFENFSEEARKIIIDNNIELTMNSSKDRPNGKELTTHTAGISKQAIKRMDLELANKIVEKINEKS